MPNAVLRYRISSGVAAPHTLLQHAPLPPPPPARTRSRAGRPQILEQKGNRNLTRFADRVAELQRGNQCRGRIYGPVATEIKVKPNAPKHAAAAIENSVQNRILASFVTEHVDDQRLLRQCAPPGVVAVVLRADLPCSVSA